MKGLLIKDFKLLMGQKNFFAAVFVVAIFLLISGTGGAAASASYVVCYVGFVSSFFVLSTIGYDEYDNGNAYLFTLPFRRSTYAVEKYIFGLSMGILTMFIMLVIEGAYFRVQDISADWTMLLVTFGSGAACLAGFLALMIPFQLKFGAEKGRIALSAVFMAVFVVVYGLAKALDANIMNLNRLIETGQKLGTAGVAAVIALIAVAALVVSAGISTRILSKKEF